MTGHPSSAPESPLGQAASRLLLVMALCMSVIAALVPTFVVPHFAAMHDNFGVDLPFITRIVVDYTLLFWAIPVITLLIWWLWPKRTQAKILALAFSGAALLGLIPLLIFALYLPIFRLGAVVG